jgi:hypothetical protein
MCFKRLTLDLPFHTPILNQQGTTMRIHILSVEEVTTLRWHGEWGNTKEQMEYRLSGLSLLKGQMESEVGQVQKVGWMECGSKSQAHRDFPACAKFSPWYKKSWPISKVHKKRRNINPVSRCYGPLLCCPPFSSLLSL